VYTGNASQPVASGIAISGDKVIGVGDDIARYAGPSTQRIDGRGQTVVPGFIDSHVHMAAIGELLNSFDLRHVKTTAEVAAIVKKAVASAAPGEWVEGRAWDETNWGGAFPTAAMLDPVSPANPVFLRRVDGHAGWANTAAMKALGITKDTKEPPGGKVVRNASGEPTGIFIDRAQQLIAGRIPPATPAQIDKRLARAAEECVRLGLTTIHDAGISRAELDAYRRLLAANRLPVRVYAMIGGSGDLWREYLKKGPEISDRLTVRSIKLVADGAMGPRGAAFWQPYSDDPGNTGLLILKKEEIAAVARDAVEHGFQVNTHAIGDRANRTVLDAYAEALGGKNDKRFRIEHAQVVSLPDFALFVKYSVIASMQSTHATSDMRWAAARLGPDRMQGAWAPKRFMALGVPVTNGSDAPVESVNPLWGFYAAVTRQDHEGHPPGGFMPEQKMTREEALRSWTAAGAYAAFEEGRKGTIEPGKLADFVLLSQDIMKVPDNQLLKTHVTMTVLGGKIVYREQ